LAQIFGVDDRSEAALWAVSHGYLPQDVPATPSKPETASAGTS